MRLWRSAMIFVLSLPALAAADYHFAADRSREQDLALSAEADALRGTWPETGAWDTALLAVQAGGSPGAQPSVEIRSGALIAEQYLAARASGLQWLNLSFLKGHVAPGATIELRPHDISIPPGPARLRLFESGLDLTRPILVLAPHPDDAEIAAFGVYADRNATIVTVTAGNAGDANYQDVFPDPAEQYRFKGYLRVVDSITVPWQGGIAPERCFNLGYFDARVAEMHEHPHEAVPEMFSPNRDILVYRRSNLGHLLPIVSRTATWDHLLEDLLLVLQKVKPGIIVVPQPSLDSHEDHEYVSVALEGALERWHHKVDLLLYTNHSDENRYPYGPAGTLMSLPPSGGVEVSVDRVYSHPVPKEIQHRKLFALEAMHDLRLSPHEQTLCGTDLHPTSRNPDVDYFRRAVRVNELFYLYDRDSFREVIRSFLKAPHPAN
jgi:hypothetical protein